jgi:hypothetical protein
VLQIFPRKRAYRRIIGIPFSVFGFLALGAGIVVTNIGAALLGIVFLVAGMGLLARESCTKSA